MLRRLKATALGGCYAARTHQDSIDVNIMNMVHLYAFIVVTATSNKWICY